MSRPGFMVYFKEWAALDSLNDAQFRAVFRAAFCYSQTGNEAVPDDPMSALAYRMLKPRLDEDLARYERKVEQTRLAGQRSGEVRSERALTDANERSKTERALTDANERERNEPITNTEAKSNSMPTAISQSATISQRVRSVSGVPTVDEVRAYVRETGLDVDVDQFMQFMEQNGWRDSQSRSIRNWHMYVNGFAVRFPKTKQPEVTVGPFF